MDDLQYSTLADVLIQLNPTMCMCMLLYNVRVLLGAEKSFVYVFNGDCVCLRRGIQLAHLTPVGHK